jgi:lipopolysaccharide O-acetyltransferase
MNEPKDCLPEKNVYSALIVFKVNVWLGLNCLVLKRIHIGENTVVGANIVVTKSLPPNVIAQEILPGSSAHCEKCTS